MKTRLPNWTNALTLALGAVRGSGLRSLLTLSGVAIGVFSIMSSVTAVRVVEAYFEDAFSYIGASGVSVTRLPPVERVDPELLSRPAVTYEQFRRLRARRPGFVSAVSSEVVFGQGEVRHVDRVTNEGVLLTGADEDFTLGNGSEIVEGRSLSAEDVHFRRQVVMLGADVAEVLFPGGGSVGKHVRVAGRSFRVVGVLSERGSFLGWSRDAYVVAPITTLLAAYGAWGRDLGRISVLATRPSDVRAAVDWVHTHMRVIRRLAPEAQSDYSVTVDSSVQDSIASFTAKLALAGVLLGLITLVTAAVGITNVMLVSVVERTPEVGVQMALGARRSDIALQFVAEAVLLCQLGGGGGVLMGVAFGNGLALWLGLEPVVPMGWTVGAFGAVTLVGIVASAYPAYRAAGLSPVEAFRQG